MISAFVRLTRKNDLIKYPLLIVVMIVMFTACKPGIKTTGVWVNKEKKIEQPYKNVFIVVLLNNMEMKQALESDLLDAARAKGLTAHTSIATFGPLPGFTNIPDKAYFLQKMKNLGCDAILTVALVDQKSETRYIPASGGIYSPYAVYPSYVHYGTFGSYWGYASTYYSPGYYETEKTYFVESNLYDANTEEILMSIQSKSDEPKSIQKSSKLYTKMLMEEVEDAKKTRLKAMK
ncbi:hypothetical protein [Pollutibacter soli]|uniref:hypothetical protein n=1 Tax=Pollutibacter soli TaxID=3034157 RepID=UPI0030137806